MKNAIKVIVIFLSTSLLITTRVDEFKIIYDPLFTFIDPDLKLTVLFGLGLVVNTLLVPLSLLKEIREKQVIATELNNHIDTIGASFLDVLATEHNAPLLSYSSIRIFLPKRTRLRHILPKILGGKRVFKYYQLDGLIKDKEIKNGSEFCVYPKKHSQGLIGKSYIEQAITMKANNIDFNEEDSSYLNNLSLDQKSMVVKHKFVLVIPIPKFNGISGFLTIDTTNSIDFHYKDDSHLLELIGKARRVFDPIKPLLK